MQSIKYNKGNYSILNQIYDVLVEIQKKDKQIILCKVSAHIGIKENEEAEKVAKQALDMPGMITTRLPYFTTYQPKLQ